MSTQAIVAVVGNNNMTRTFDLTATDGTVFTTQNLLDTNADQNLGILIPGVVIDSVQCTYAAGLAQYRIINSQNQVVARQGFASKATYVCPMEAKIPPYKIQPTDLLQVFCKAVNSTSNDSEVMAWVQTSGGIESFSVTTTSDNSPTEMLNSITGQTLGDWAFGKTVQRISLQLEDGAFLNDIEIYDQTGSIQWTALGNTRLPTAGGKSTLVNLDVPVGIKVEKGFALKVSATTA